MKTAYYAHPLTLYGTPQEQADLEAIQQAGWTPLNPNGPEHEAGYRRDGMCYFEKLVAGCDLLVFRPFIDGSIPAGIATEIESALIREKPIFELPTNLERRKLNVPVTRELLKQSGRR